MINLCTNSIIFIFHTNAKNMQSFSPIYYEYDLSDTSFESEEASDDSEDSNYRPVGNNTRVKKRKVGLSCISQTHYSPIIYSKS